MSPEVKIVAYQRYAIWRPIRCHRHKGAPRKRYKATLKKVPRHLQHRPPLADNTSNQSLELATHTFYQATPSFQNTRSATMEVQ